ncbi:toxin-antitoxin system YwqK family antitoxin [Flavobacterium sp.]|uniref:toxin-antitoxin system YwqK family antitoxin n=1 Tax=Flavobacterium sp. TaxID=239 RepID=UPI0037532E75
MRYLLLILFFTTSIFAQEINKLDDKGLKNGLWKGTYEDSKRPRFEGTFNHGKEVGIFKFFDNTAAGTVIATREFSENDNSCYTIFYNQSKNKVSEGKLINKIYVGEWKYYHENSPQIMTTENYINGKLEGVRKVYYLSGKIAEETSYKAGIKNGSYKKYTENGILLEDSLYKNGEFDGLATFKNATDAVVAKGVFKNGKKEGMWDILKKGKLVKENMSKQKQRKFVKKEITREE